MEPSLKGIPFEMQAKLMEFLPEDDVRALGETDAEVHELSKAVLSRRAKSEKSLAKDEFYQETTPAQKKIIGGIKDPTQKEAEARLELKKNIAHSKLYDIQKEKPQYKKQALMLDLEKYIKEGNKEEALKTLEQIEKMDNTWVNSIRDTLSQVFHYLKLIED